MEVENPDMAEWRLTLLRTAIKLERAGMKHSSGRSAKAAVIKELGMKRNSSYDAVIEAINKKIGELCPTNA